MPEENQSKETLFDLSQKKSNISPEKPQIPTFHWEERKPRSKRWLWIVLIIILILIIGMGGYFYYYYIYSGKYDLARYQKGPSVNILQKDVANFFYAQEMETIYYQKNNDPMIYGDFLDLDKKDWSILDSKRGTLLSVSPNGKKAVIYYAEEVSDIKDSQENYFIANLEDNKMFSIGGKGSSYENFIWLENDLIFTRNMNEVLDYDFDLAKYQYNPEVSNFKKITDLKYPLISMAVKPGASELYILSDLTKKNTDFSNNISSYETSETNYTLSKFEMVEKKFTDILETTANYFDFSPSGKYYLFYDSNNRDLSIYDTEKKSLVGQISGLLIAPYKFIWTNDEKGIFYFSQDEVVSNNERISPVETLGYYENLMKYNLESKENKVLVKGKEKNIANVNDFFIDAKNKLYLTTAQINNIFEMELP